MAEIRVNTTGTLKLYENDNTSYVQIAAPSSLGANRTITIPDADVDLSSVGFSVSNITGATALAVEPALTDEMVLSDAGTLKRLDMQHVMNVPAFHAYMSTSQNFASGTGATVEYNTERFDIGSCYNTTDYKFTPGVAGWYWLYGVNYFASGIDDGEQHASFVRKNGTDIYRYGYTEIQSARTDMTSMGTFNIIVYADADDYFECRVWQNSGSTLSLNRDYGSWGGFRITGVDSSAPSSGPPEN